jgi:hypothetical protein
MSRVCKLLSLLVIVDLAPFFHVQNFCLSRGENLLFKEKKVIFRVFGWHISKNIHAPICFNNSFMAKFG